MRLIAITGTDAEGRVTKYVAFDDDARAEIEVVERTAGEALTAEQAVMRFQADHPDAEIVEDTLGGDPAQWRKVDGDWVIDPRPAPRQTVLAYSAFEDRFTAAEQDALADFVYATDPATGRPLRKQLLKAYNRAVASNRVDLDAPETAAFMDALVSGDVLGADTDPETNPRKAEILA
ncbi:hypothetical protein [Minwuia thermotolerans]|uniref:Uncharacterized protein n=1 Tax=Minwuia thermotolerans TaxID=2056226 RepID=A0A2M9G2P4_9PROT|nr:hypothetical protein [Minwuia thermotolerans]PJK29970.1 hypothetical protein CVT23_09390 [Minwuia thermotolerans]